MRISIMIVVFLILFNGWTGLIQQYGVDDHLGINAETGNPEKLDKAVSESEKFNTGDSRGGTLIGMYNSLSGMVEAVVRATQPGADMLVNIMPPGPAEDFIIWIFGIAPLLAGLDIAAYLRGADL